MTLAQPVTSSPIFKQTLLAFLVISVVILLPDTAFAIDETGEEVTTSILANFVKYAKWIAFGIIGAAFMIVGYYCLRAYGSWADEENNKGTLPRLIGTVFLGILILAVVTIFVTKGAKYLEDNITTAAITPVTSNVIA